jgi:murein DD-endopeptidase MepM/ murein hydrolase activator NlpD
MSSGHDSEPAEGLTPPSLDERSAFEWRGIAREVLRSRARVRCSDTNAMLLAAAEREPQSPAAPAFRLWAADNLARDGLFAEAVAAYDGALAAAQSAPRLLEDHDPVIGILHQKAGAAALAGDAAHAIRTCRDVAEHDPSDKSALFFAGLLAEEQRDHEQAEDLYRSAAAQSPAARTDDPAELARRALERLEQPPSAFAADARQVADTLLSALDARDAGQLHRAAGLTHLAVGPVGGHTSFEPGELLDELGRDLLQSRITAQRTLSGSGDKLYLQTQGWKGRWYQGSVVFVLTRAPRGWQWTGIGVAAPNELWVERWRPAITQENQPLPFELLAPWPAGESFKAGGLKEYALQQAVVLAAAWFGPVVAFQFSRNPCGFGPRGLYYNQWPTHEEEDAFAIDFTRYRRNVPYWPESGGTPVLAARGGTVVYVRASIPNGNPSFSNTVVIAHADPADPTKPKRFHSRYLHMEGPYDIKVSEGMEVPAGTRLGLMDDTGNSVLNHLHFSIHDWDLPRPGAQYGASVRPTPLSGVRLEDGDDGACVRSTNVEYREPPIIEVTDFAGQNWVITPEALAVSEDPPAKVEDQKFLLVLSGIAVVDFQGESTADWRRATLLIRPDVDAPMQHAITEYGIPTPPGTSGAQYWTALQVEHWAPFAAPSAMFNRGVSNNSGFAVDRWRPNPFESKLGFANTMIGNLFSGVLVDVAVRDTDAVLHRVSYSVTLVGKIVFGPIIIR